MYELHIVRPELDPVTRDSHSALDSPLLASAVAYPVHPLCVIFKQGELLPRWCCLSKLVSSRPLRQRAGACGLTLQWTVQSRSRLPPPTQTLPHYPPIHTQRHTTPAPAFTPSPTFTFDPPTPGHYCEANSTSENATGCRQLLEKGGVG